MTAGLCTAAVMDPASYSAHSSAVDSSFALVRFEEVKGHILIPILEMEKLGLREIIL